MKQKRIGIYACMIVMLTLFVPQVLAMTSPQNSNNQITTTRPSALETSADQIQFIQPVPQKMYIVDKVTVSLNGDRTIIIGPITLEVATEAQNDLTSVRYHFTDLNNTQLEPDIEITWSEAYPNYNYYYAVRHLPFKSQDFLPSKFKIEAIAEFIGIPYASTNITVFKLF